jgi:meiotically up-regulated gene 157 (Mug157) protein
MEVWSGWFFLVLKRGSLLEVTKRNGVDVLAYEIDGFGNSYFMDDANIPNLLSLSYMDFLPSHHPLYVQTRAAVLNRRLNQFFFVGQNHSGLGSMHTNYGFIWFDIFGDCLFCSFSLLQTGTW